jgi:hypothetical protein
MSVPFFYGLESRSDILFKIYVTPGALHGAAVGTGIYDKGNVGADLFPYGLIVLLLLRGWRLRQVIANRAALETKYDALVPGSPEFLEGHEHNFTIERSEILYAKIAPRPVDRKGRPTWDGHIDLMMTDGTKRTFYLIERQDPAVVNEWIDSLVLGGSSAR